MSAEKWPRTVKVGNFTTKVYRIRHETASSGWTFVLAYHEAGKRKRQKFSDATAALAEARLKADQLNAGRVEGASMSRSDRDELQASRTLCGEVPLLAALNEWRKVRDLTGGNAIQAAEAWAARNATAFRRSTVNDAVTNFIAAKERTGVDVSCSYKKILPTLAVAFTGRYLDTISTKELQHWMDEKYPHPVTRNTARKRFVTLWRWCRKQGHLPRDAQTEAEQTDSAREAVKEIGIIKVDTFEKLLHHFLVKHPEYLAALVIAGFTGLRRSEIHEQTWEDITLDRKILRVTSAKRNTPARRLVPLSDAAVEWLLKCKNRKGGICTNLAMDRIRNIGRDAKFDLPENCFRHAYISHRVAQTGNVAETALESGNSPTIIFQHYRELFDKADGEAWFSVRPGKSAKPTGIDSKIAVIG